MRKCALSKLPDVFEKIASEMTLFLPVDREDGRAEYQQWVPGKALSDALTTVKSPKDLFFPQTEDLMRFKVEGKKIAIDDIREDVEPFAVFGVRACDVRSLDILDRVFLTEPRDSYYAEKREKGVVVSLSCEKPAETCFCTAFGIDPLTPAGDVAVWKTETALFFKANTEKGGAFLKIIEELTEDTAGEEVEAVKAKTEKILQKLPLRDVPVNAFGGGKTQALFDRPEWDTLSESCLGCGTCTFVCPTCQCYDIKDFSAGNAVIRYRCWDSCMYSEFTKMAHGNNRVTQKERFRQRFMHKLVYFPENHDGLFSCVGCGRCLRSCPVSMNIVKVMRKIGGKHNA